MTNQEITEAYFVARGWRPIHRLAIFAGVKPVECFQDYFWVEKDEDARQPNPKYYTKLPNILESYPDWQEQVLDEMIREGFALTSDSANIHWKKTGDAFVKFSEPIVNGKILRAAVIAATKYFEAKNAN